MDRINFIEELFEGKIYNMAQANNHSERLQKIINNILETGKELNALLSDNQRELFCKYNDLQKQHIIENEFKGFKNGFRLGASCMLDTFQKND